LFYKTAAVLIVKNNLMKAPNHTANIWYKINNMEPAEENIRPACADEHKPVVL